MFVVDRRLRWSVAGTAVGVRSCDAEYAGKTETGFRGLHSQAHQSFRQELRRVPRSGTQAAPARIHRERLLLVECSNPKPARLSIYYCRLPAPAESSTRVDYSGGPPTVRTCLAARKRSG